MAESSQAGHQYLNVQNYDSRIHMGNVNNYGESSDERTLRAILESLSYPDMKDRRNELAEAHKGTFEWTFLEGKTEFVKSRSFYGHGSKEYLEIDMNFKTWLEAKNQGLFCIVGKPGSGKSTFMYAPRRHLRGCDMITDSTQRKSLATHPDLEKILKKWADSNVLILADHYFWILGTTMQKTFEGLLRHLLHSVLHTLSHPDVSANLEALRRICGPRWSSINKHKAWSCTELKEMLSRLSSMANLKTFFLVDALDEFEPQDDLGSLADGILWMSRLPNTKLCVSCRHWEVLTRKFGQSPTISLDQLTCHDMELYVGHKLKSAEAETDSKLGFHDKSPSTRNFVRHVVISAEGVFLWIELALKAICSEIRKGKDLEQLKETMFRFPVNLNDYLRRLIFNRIGRTQQNILDTAAALKLAMVISLDVKSDRTQLPCTQSFCNFWLLSKGYLKSGFTWTDPIDASQLDQERMVRHTANFLHEACKDLFMISVDSSGKVNVDFSHRTVFDFLCERSNLEFLKEYAPGHFSNNNFASKLAEFRCICLLSDDQADCRRSLDVLDEALKVQVDGRQPFDADWFSAIESLTLKHIKMKCTCFGLRHVPSSNFATYCIQAKRHQFLIESTAIMPHHVFGLSNYGVPNMLESLLLVATKADIDDPGMILLCHLLERGCQSHSFVDKWQYQSEQNISVRERTYWEALLSDVYIRLHRDNGEEPQEDNTEHDSGALQKDRAIAIIELLLHHGADPSCRPCITDHKKHQVIDPDCRHVTLSEIFERIFSPEERLSLQRALADVITASTHRVLRRNQHRRAMRSFITSENAFTTSLVKAEVSPKRRRDGLFEWQDHQEAFLECMLALPELGSLGKQQRCRCYQGIDPSGLVTWCVDCQAVSFICINCFPLSPSELPPREHPCEAFPGMPT